MRSILCVAVVVAAGCGSDNSIHFVDGGGGGDGSSDLANFSPPDLTPVFDLAGPTFQCGSQTCGTGATCCVSGGGGGPTGMCVVGSCADGGVPVQCRSPDQCQGNPCCLTLANNVPQSVLCAPTATDCKTMFTGSATMVSGQTRLCRNAADCTNGDPQTQNPDCCTTTVMGVSQQFCFNSQLAPFTNGMVTCP